jgi:predicted GNAT family acetyltransferase
MQVVVVDQAERHRYLATIDGRDAGFLEYIASRGPRALVHTEVDVRFEGQGIGGALARYALDDARANNVKVWVTCPFVIDWLRRHQDYLDVVYQSTADSR